MKRSEIRTKAELLLALILIIMVGAFDLHMARRKAAERIVVEAVR